MDYDARDFLISSDSPLDKVIGMMSGSRNVPAFDSLTITNVAHPFTFTPLALTMYSFDSSFSSAKDEGLAQYADPSNMVSVTSYTNATNLRLAWYSNIQSSRTVYWRTYFFMPTNVDAEVNYTAIDSDDFVINSDYNYAKLLDAGVNSGNFSVTHNLGYFPQVIAWNQGPLGLSRITNGGGYPELADVRINENTVQFRGQNQTHYRIYIDE